MSVCSANGSCARAAATSQAVVTDVTDTNASENDATVYRYTFRFETAEEETTTARSYSTGRLYSRATEWTSSICQASQVWPRLQGTRLSTFSPWVMPFVSIFPLIGLVMLVVSTVSGLRQVFLLIYGEIGGGASAFEQADRYAREQAAGDLNTATSCTPAMGRRTRRVRALPSGRVGGRSRRSSLYLPSNPKLSVLVDALPLRYPLESTRVASGCRASQFGRWCGLAWRGWVSRRLWFTACWLARLMSVAALSAVNLGPGTCGR